MSMLTSETKKLLDRLYNLRGEDSVILTKMEDERLVAEETKERTTKQKEDYQKKIEELTEEEKMLVEEGDRLLQALSKIQEEDYKNVLNKLEIDFDPEDLNKKVSTSLPKTIERVQKETSDSEKELISVEEEMNNAIATIEELAIRKDEALSNQNKLNEYFDLAFDGNINITRDSIATLLKSFDFNEVEQREAAKILMFPEDALFEYDQKLKDKENNVKNIEKEEPKKEEVTIEIKEEKEELSPKDRLINILEEYGFDYLDFTNNDIDYLVDNYDEDILRENVEYSKNMNMNLDMFTENIKLLLDKEYKDKIEKLLSIGKKPVDIYLYPNILNKYSKNELANTIDKFENSGLDPKMVPLIAY